MAYIPRHAKQPFGEGVPCEAFRRDNSGQTESKLSRRDLLACAGGSAAFLAAALTNNPALAHAVESGNASQDDLAKLAYEVSDLSFDVSDLSESVGNLGTRLSQAEGSIAGAADVAGKFPVANSDIADGTIGTGKLSDQAKADIIQGIAIRHFDNKQYGADNTGLICPASGELAGFYVPELTLLVITKYYKPYGMADTNWMTSETKFRLPSYVPHVTENITLAPLGLIDFDENQAYTDWHGFGLNTQGYVGGIGSSGEDEGRILVGNVVSFLRPYIALE